jgi:exodeoxyribonuclease VII large subunit
MLNGMARQRRHLDACAKLLASLGYHGVLQRGFALVRDSAGRSVRSMTQVAAGQRLDIEFADGHVAAQAVRAGGPQGAEKRDTPPTPAAARTKPGPRGGNQGSLF